MKTASEILSEAGYSEDQIAIGIKYADSYQWDDEDERGAYALAKILYSESQLVDSPKAPWDSICYEHE
jgi:hypothetical protein